MTRNLIRNHSKSFSQIEDCRQAILSTPFELWDFIQWHTGTKSNHECFHIELHDQLSLVPTLKVSKLSSRTITISSAHGKISITSANVLLFERIVTCLQTKTQSAFDVAKKLGITMDCVMEIVENLLNVVIVTPNTIRGLERRIYGFEICRIPITPYGIVRNYWRNMADVRSVLPEMTKALKTIDKFCEWLRYLHVISVMGLDLNCFYRPPSRVSAVRIEPGHFRHTSPTVTISEQGIVKYLHYLRLSWTEGSLPMRMDAFFPSKNFGTELTYRAPRPLRIVYFESMRKALDSAIYGLQINDGATVLSSLAKFHRNFIRYHPFSCSNQSIAMNIVNQILRDMFYVIMPHLYLDFCALVLSEKNYIKVFSKAVSCYQIPVRPIGDVAAMYSNRNIEQFIGILEMFSKPHGEVLVETLIRKQPKLRTLLLYGSQIVV